MIDVLNPKGQREKKLQENLRKIKDRLKLKKTKKVAAAKMDATKDKATEGAQSEKHDETKTEDNQLTENGINTPK